MALSLPKFLNIPAKLYPIIFKLNLFRYFLLEGGRGSAKSQSVARLILFIGSKNKIRVVCGREIQASIEESVYTLLVDLIREQNLNYAIYKTKLVHQKTGTTIRFRGFREHGAINIKGLEGIDILFIDEAQAISKQTLKILIPTIRKNKAKVFFVMNRYLTDDPAYIQFVGRDDCLHIHIDYFENPHCTDALKREADECKATNMDDYLHIWLGQPLKKANRAAFNNVDSIIDFDLPLIIKPQRTFHYSFGADLAKSVDHTSISGFNIELKELHYFKELESENKSSWHFQKQLITGVCKRYNDALLTTDSTGVGDPITEDLQRAVVNVFVDQNEQKENPKEVAGYKFTQISKKNLVEKLKVAIELQTFRIPNHVKLVKQLKQYEALIMPNGNIKYGAPAGKDDEGNPIYHDDNVMSLALALWGSGTMIYDPEYKAPKEVTETDRFWKDVKKQIVNRNSQTNALQDNEFDDIIEISDEGMDIEESEL